MIRIRRFQEGEEASLWDVFFSAIHDIASSDYTPEQIDAWAPRHPNPERWADRIRGIAPFVAEHDGQIVGYADVQENGYIDHFFVSATSARQGVGSLLMRKILETAREQGTTSLFAEVSITARPFFEKWGFEVEKMQYVSIRGVTLQNFRMRKYGLWSRR